jgi:uncharacterized protein YcgI (DUF1989 family)
MCFSAEMQVSNSSVETSVEVPGYSGRSVPVRRGAPIRITDVCGTQIGDLFALSQENHSEFLSASVTRAVTWRLFPEVGQCFYTTLRRPILTFLEDHSPGIHDMLFAPCDQLLFEELGWKGPHPNCRDNYLRAAAEAGIRHTVVPDPVNIFENTPPREGGVLLAEVTPTKPGDYLVLRAEMDLVLILTACSVDIGLNQINGGKSTPLRIEVLRG